MSKYTVTVFEFGNLRLEKRKYDYFTDKEKENNLNTCFFIEVEGIKVWINRNTWNEIADWMSNV